jgi:hypothetical protein
VRALRMRERLGTLSEIFRNPQLRRLELAWCGYYLGEWTPLDPSSNTSELA